MGNQWVRIVVLALLCTAGCNSRITIGDSGTSDEPIDFGNVDASARAAALAGPLVDGGPSGTAADAFFEDDPPPPYCGPDGEREEARDPGGAPGCPADKNRQGCPCPEDGMEDKCWPGLRSNRGHGICEDGTTTCRKAGEFGLQWGPCDGYELPDKGAESGPETCSCFSNGKWILDNLVPCVQERNGRVYMYSSAPQEDGGYKCATLPSPPPVPAEHWTDSVVNVDCEGRFELCYTIKAGDVGDPQDDDCIIMQQCFDLWYETAGEDHPLQLPGWASDAGRCGQRFTEVSGYGEMTVRGLSATCDEVDDGAGNPLVFFRTNYCPSDCTDRPNDDECRSCTTGGAGDF